MTIRPGVAHAMEKTLATRLGRLLLVVTVVVAAAGVAAAQNNASVLNAGLGAPPEGVVRNTPRDTVLGYLDACRAGGYARAAHYLNLSELPLSAQASEGPRLARRLKLVLDQKLWVDPDALSDTPAGQTDDDLPPDQDRIGRIPLDGGAQGIRVQRVTTVAGSPVWVLAASTVRVIDSLYDVYGIGWLGDYLPDWWFRIRVWEIALWQLFGLLLLLMLSYVLGRLLTGAVIRLLGAMAQRTHVAWDDEIVAILRGSLPLLLWALLFDVGSGLLHLALPVTATVTILVRSALLLAIGWFSYRLLKVLARLLEAHLVKDLTEDRKRKAVATQVNVMLRLVSATMVLVIVALGLSQFEVMRTVGLSLLASAGIAGIVIGFAAQRSVANLFAGVQIMLTQPIRIDDVVVVEGEWGTVEEINFSHVSIKIWDQRRLILPIGYFLERPFQNWTRVSPELLGTVFFYTDYRIDLERMRSELAAIVAATPLWDGRVSGIQVTDLKEHVVEVRVLVSAASGPKLWDLRCLVREKLLEWLRTNSAALPQLRIASQEVLAR